MDQPTEERSQVSTDPDPLIAPNRSTSKEPVSDVVSFSLCSLCAIKLGYLYPEKYFESFRRSTIEKLVEHFHLPKRVIQCVQEFTPEDEFTFLTSIRQQYKKHGSFKLIEELVLASISSGSYDARAHYLIIEVAEVLGIPRDLVEIHCESIYSLLLKAQNQTLAAGEQNEPDLESERYRERRDNKTKIKRYVMIGLASLGGGAVIGLTGGLAAPIVASAFAGAIGAGTIVMSSAAAGVVGSLFGVAGAGLTASKMNKRIGDLEEFAFQCLSPEDEHTSLTITIAISGWISDDSSDQFAKPWKYLRNTKEQYCLCYESKYLLELSRAMDYLLSFVVSYATQEALKYTFLASVMAAIAWPTALISIANIIDNPWDVCIGRSAQAGKHLADVLISRQQGKRPASLIGFSLGARVIFFCLQELAQRKDSEGIIADVVLLGAPVTASLDQWKPLGRIVSGRIINGYSSSDWLLKFLYRTSSAAIRVAGLEPLRWKDRRVKNIDLTQLVSGHMDYYKKLTEILDFVNIRTVARFGDDLQLATTPDSPLLTATTNQLGRSSDETQVVSNSTGISGSDAATSGIGRTISNSTNISASLSQQSLTEQTPVDSQQYLILPSTLTDATTPSTQSSSYNSGQAATGERISLQANEQHQHQQQTTEPVARNAQVCRQPLSQSKIGLLHPRPLLAASSAAHRCRRPSSLVRKRENAADLRAQLRSSTGAQEMRNRSRSI